MNKASARAIDWMSLGATLSFGAWISQRGRHPVGVISGLLSRNLAAKIVELLDDSQSMVSVVQTPSAAFGHRDNVLDPYAEPPRQIDPWLHREAHAWHE
jgi:hypothetical protein